MELILHTPGEKGVLSDRYREALANATELFIVTAYLTDWDEALTLNDRCKLFRLIIGKDFCITRKAACQAVLRWLPAKRKSQFLVADMIDGFHPKAVFWSAGGKYYAIVGSSNLTKAAFETNYEANVFSRISKAEYERAKQWIRRLEQRSVGVSGDWLSKYTEAKRASNGGRRKGASGVSGTPLIPLRLPNPRYREREVARRRKQLKTHQRYRQDLIALFRRCSNRAITPDEFYQELSNHWSRDIGNRLQGSNWEILGKGSDFWELSDSFVTIIDSPDENRDDTVAEEIDRLAELRVPTRAAFLSEMLCLEFPTEYPVLNKPIRRYRSHIKFRAPYGGSEGAKYVDFARKLRFSVLQNPGHAARNLAELDAVIWLAYGD